MVQNRYIDVEIKNTDRTSTINFTQFNFSFSMNMGGFINACYEAENILLLIFDKGEIRIEISLEELTSNILSR